MFDQTTYLKKLGYAQKILPMLEVTLRCGEAVVQLPTESPALVRNPPPPWEKAKGCQWPPSWWLVMQREFFWGSNTKQKIQCFVQGEPPRVIKIRWFITPRNTIALSTTKYHEPSYKPRGRGHTVNQDFRKPLENLLPSSNLTLPWKMFMVNRQTTNRIKMVCLGGCYVNIPEMKVSICLGNYCSLL